MSDDRQTLADVMSRYAAAIDERDLEAFRELFVKDVEVVGFGRESFGSVDYLLVVVR